MASHSCHALTRRGICESNHSASLPSRLPGLALLPGSRPVWVGSALLEPILDEHLRLGFRTEDQPRHVEAEPWREKP